MTLAELEPLSRAFSFGNARLNLRYDMRALLALEKAGLKYTDIFAESLEAGVILRFFRAGLTEEVGAERAAKMFRAIGGREVWALCSEAMLLALPKPDPLLIPDTKAKKSEVIDFGALRCYICDIMKKPDEFFWSSTLRELLERWQKFAVFKGYMKPPRRMEMFDTEGME